MFVGSLLTSRHPFYTHGLRRSLEEAISDVVATDAKSRPLSMRLDVREDAQAFHLAADMPGLSEKDIELTFDEGVLTIAGEKSIARDQKDDTWHVTERASGRFERQISLSVDIDADKITASFDKGVLNVTMPKLPAAQKSVKKINVTTPTSAS